MEWVWWTQVEIHLCPRWQWRGFVNTCWNAFSVLVRKRWVCLTHVLHFASWLALEGFCQEMLRCNLCVWWHGIILVITCWYAFCILAGLGWVWSALCELHLACPLVRNLFGQHSLGFFCVLACIECVSSSGVEMHFVYYLALERFSQHKLRYILWFIETQFHISLVNRSWYACVRWHWVDFVNTCWFEFCVLAGVVGLLWIHVELRLVSLLV